MGNQREISEHIRDILHERGINDKVIATMDADRIFAEVLEWSGIGGYEGSIKRWIKAIYGVDVKEASEGESK